MEGEECVRRALEEVEASDSWTEEASEGDSFVDIMGGLEKLTGGESEEFTFEGILQRARLYWRLWSILLICHCVSLQSPFLSSF